MNSSIIIKNLLGFHPANLFTRNVMGVMFLIASFAVPFLLPVSLEWRISWITSIARYLYSDLFVLLGFVFLIPNGVVNKSLFSFSLICLVLGIIHSIIFAVHPLYSILNFLDFTLPFLVASFVRFDEVSVGPISFVIFGLLCLLSLQSTVVYLGLYESDAYGAAITSNVQNYGELFRVPTTIGSATATASGIFLLTGISLALFRGRFFWLAMAGFVGGVSILLSLARGPILMFVIGAVVALSVSNESLFRWRLWLRIFFGVCFPVSSIAIFSTDNLFSEAIKERLGRAYSSNYGRIDRALEAIGDFRENPFFGCGFGQYTPRGRFQYQLGIDDFVSITSPHNIYLLISAELGILFGIIILLFLGYITLTSYARQGFSLGFIMLSVLLLIGFNTEILYLDGNFGVLFSLLVAVSLADLRAISYGRRV